MFHKRPCDLDDDEDLDMSFTDESNINISPGILHVEKDDKKKSAGERSIEAKAAGTAVARTPKRQTMARDDASLVFASPPQHKRSCVGSSSNSPSSPSTYIADLVMQKLLQQRHEEQEQKMEHARAAAARAATAAAALRRQVAVAAAAAAAAGPPVATQQSPTRTKKYSRPSTAQARPSIRVLPNSSGMVLMTDVHEHDVLSGRGGRVNAHAGNVNLRQCVDAHKMHYLHPSTRKLEKAYIAYSIVQEIRSLNPPGRFLKEDVDGSGRWYEIGDAKAIKKVGQALREDAPTLRVYHYDIVLPQQQEQQQPPTEPPVQSVEIAVFRPIQNDQDEERTCESSDEPRNATATRQAVSEQADSDYFFHWMEDETPPSPGAGI